MKTRRMRIFVAALVSAAASLAGGTASADSAVVDGTQYSIVNSEGTEGNSLIGNYHSVFNRASAGWMPTATDFTPNSYTVTDSWLADYGYIFDNEYQLIFAAASSTSKMDGSGAPFNYMQDADASFYVLGSQIATPSKGTCDRTSICASVESSYSRSLFGDHPPEYTFTVGFVPIKVSADVVATLSTGASANAYAKPFIGRQGEFVGQTASSVNARAKVTANMSASLIGWNDVLDFGVTAHFDIIDISGSHHANEFLLTRPHYANVQWSIGTPVGISTMNGSADVWADTLFGDFSENIVSWNGASWSTDLWSDSGSRTFPQ